MEIITLKAILHNGMECIGIFSKPNAELNAILKKETGARWSRTHTCWHVSLSKKNYELLAKVLQGKAILQTDVFKAYLENKKKAEAAYTITSNTEVKKHNAAATPVYPPAYKNVISKENNAALKKFKQHLILKAYSPSTIRTYINEFVQFLNTINNVPAETFTAARIKDYLQYCYEKLKLKENTLHSRINALKFYFEQVLNKEKIFGRYQGQRNIFNYLNY